MTALALSLSFVFGLLPMALYALGVRAFDRYEKEPWRLLIGAFVWGAVVAAGGAFIINTTFEIGIFLLTNSERAADFSGSVLVAPLVEETLKGLAVLAVFLRYRHEFDSVLDGILYASMAGFGFAATENVYYIFQKGYLESGLAGLAVVVAIRVILVAFQHAFYTSFTGIGLALARLSRNKLTAIAVALAGFAAAMFTHALHNLFASVGSPLTCLVGSLFDWSGALGMIALLGYLARREGRILAHYLREEVDSGLLTETEYLAACSLSSRAAVRLRPLAPAADDRSRARRLLDLCGELAFKKHQLTHHGEERDNTARVADLRAQLAALTGRPVVQSGPDSSP